MTLTFDSYEEEQAFRAGEAHERARQSSSRSATSPLRSQSEDENLDTAIEDAASSIRLAQGRDQFSLDALLPPDLAKAVELVTEQLPADALTSTMTLLCGYSGLLKLGTKITPDGRYKVPCNLFVGLVAPSGLTKSPLQRALIHNPTLKLQQEEKARHQQLLKEWEENDSPEKDKHPPRRCPLHQNEFSPEALAMWLESYESNGLGVLLTRMELSGMLRGIDADTKRGRGTAEAQFLESYDGDGCTSLRVGKNGTGEVRSYSSCHVSLFGGIQDQVLRELINGSDASGKFARLNFVKCPLRPLNLKDDPITPPEQKAYELAEGTLASWADVLYKLPPRTYELSLEARRHLNRWFRAHQLEALRPSTPSVISAMLGKTSGNALRVAGMLHLVWTKGADSEAEISLAHIRFATAMVDQCVAETREFHQPPDTIGTVMMRHVHSLSWDNDRVQDELITWQIAKDNGNTPIRKGGAKGFSKAITKLEEMGFGKRLQVGTVFAFKATKPWP